MSFLLRLTGRRKDSECRDSLPAGDLTAENDEDSRRRPSFLRMVSLSKLRGDSLTNRSSQEDEQESVEEELPVKRREPLSGTAVLLLSSCLYLLVLLRSRTKSNYYVHSQRSPCLTCNTLLLMSSSTVQKSQ